jgi:molecular chaperone DnaJ
MFGMMQSQKQCEECRGRGKTVKTPCKNCNGKGYVKLTKKLNVSIPAGIDNGGRICLRGQGNAGANGGNYGDLYIIVAIRPHEIFERDNYDIYCEVPVSFTQATLGSEIDVPTLEAPIKYTVPEGTQPGTVFRIKGSGIQNLHGAGKGDLYMTVKVEVPRKLTDKQKELLRQFEGTITGKEYEEKKSFFERMKDAFN